MTTPRICKRCERAARVKKPFYGNQQLEGRRIDDRTFVLMLPLPPTKNDEPANKWSRRDMKNLWAQYAYHCWLAAGKPRFNRVETEFRFFVHNLRDGDNSNSLAVKGILDGLKGNLMPDDSPKYLKILSEIQTVDRDNQRLEVHINGIG